MAVYFLAPKQPTLVIPASTPASANYQPTDYYEVCLGNANGNLSMTIVQSGLDQADGVVKLKRSDDGVNWFDVDGSSVTLAAGSTSPQPITFSNQTAKYLKPNYSKGSNTVGTIQLSLSLT